MKPKSVRNQYQGNLLYPDLLEQLDTNQPLIILGKIIPWEKLEDALMPLYAQKGRPGKPIRLMVGLLIIKYLYDLSDERLIHDWVQNPYYQAFCGEHKFQFEFPCDPSELTHFRKRIGENGAKEIFSITQELFIESLFKDDIVIDTTVQEKNITFPTDSKLRFKVIDNCLKLIKGYCLKIKKKYLHKVKNIKRELRFKKDEDNSKSLLLDELKVIANKLINSIEKKLPPELLKKHRNDIDLWRRAVNQEKESKNKIYSLHEPHVYCIAKGKERTRYEFGNIVSIAILKNTGIIVGIYSFEHHVHDSKTLQYLIDQVYGVIKYNPKEAFCDRGFRGVNFVNNTKITIPDIPDDKKTPYQKQKARKNFGRRCAIEPEIGHLKNNYRLSRNYLRGILGDKINPFLSATAYNIKKWINILLCGEELKLIKY